MTRQALNCIYGNAQECRLDLYVPSGVEKPPLLMFIRGGNWRAGNRRLPFLVGLAQNLNAQGIACAVIDYRHMPRAPFPTPVIDAATAFGWLWERRKRFGKLYIAGFSAGAHSAALLALDKEYLRGHAKCDPDTALSGVVLLSGIYEIKNNVSRAFTNSPSLWAKASTSAHLRKAPFPFLLISSDSEGSFTQNTIKLEEMLASVGNHVVRLELPSKPHTHVAADLRLPDDYALINMVAFIRGDATPSLQPESD